MAVELLLIGEFVTGATVSVVANVSKLTQNTYITSKLKHGSTVYEFDSNVDQDTKICTMTSKLADFPIPANEYEFIVTWWTDVDEPIAQRKYKINVLPFE